jgi:hypothetical protein
MVVGFTTTSEITTNVENLNLSHGEVYSIQHYVIKFVSELRQVGDFLHQNKTDRHDITEILLKVALNTTIQSNLHNSFILIQKK